MYGRRADSNLPGIVFSAREPFCIEKRKSWGERAEWETKLTIRLFACDRLFEEHKELLNLFTKFHKLTTRDEQASSEELAEHAVSVMTTLDESIRSLDNVDTFILYLHQVGQSHYKIAGFQKEYFWVGKIFFSPFVP